MSDQLVLAVVTALAASGAQALAAGGRDALAALFRVIRDRFGRDTADGSP